MPSVLNGERVSSAFRPWVILLVGLAIRLCVAPYTGHPWDLSVWTDAGYRTVALGQNVYEVAQQTHWEWGYYAYPPAWLAWLSFSYFFHANLNVYVLFLKLPLIIADTVIAYLLYRVSLRVGSEKTARRMFLLYYLNPFVILVGAVWGMFDALPALFTFAAIMLLVDRKFSWSAVCLGIGGLLKIYPLLLIPLILLFIRRGNLHWYSRQAISYVSIVAGMFLAISSPFLIWDWRSYALTIMGHLNPSVWFSYWSLLGHLNSSFYSIAPWGFLILFSLGYAIILKRASSSDMGLLSVNSATLSVILCFLATAPKINVQYLLWIIPLSLLEAHPKNQSGRRFLPYFTSSVGALAIVLTLPINKFLVLNYEPPPLSAGLVGSIAAGVVVLSLITPGVLLRSVGWVPDFKGFNPLKPYRLVIPVLMVVLAFSLVSSPLPEAIAVQNGKPVFAEPESVASGFDVNSQDLGAKSFLHKYSSNFVVLSFGPDFADTYGGYNASAPLNSFLRVSYYDEWHHSQLRNLVSELHGGGAHVLVGISLLSTNIVAGRGYSSPWLEGGHPEVLEGQYAALDKALTLDQTSGIYEQTEYYVYLTQKLTSIVQDFSFDGVSLSDLYPTGAVSSNEAVKAYVKPLSYMSAAFHSKGLIFAAKLTADEPVLEINRDIIRLLDFAVLQTLPWSEGVYGLNSTRDVDYYLTYAKLLFESLPPQEASKVLYALEVMDEQTGWFVPTLFMQNSERAFSTLPFRGLYVTYANKYSPYSVAPSN